MKILYRQMLLCLLLVSMMLGCFTFIAAASGQYTVTVENVTVDGLNVTVEGYISDDYTRVISIIVLPEAAGNYTFNSVNVLNEALINDDLFDNIVYTYGAETSVTQKFSFKFTVPKYGNYRIFIVGDGAADMSPVAFTATEEIPDSGILPTISGHSEKLSNTGFENLFNSSWVFYKDKTTGETYGSKSYDYAHTGYASAKLYTAGTELKRSYFMQSIKNLVVGATYQLSAWVYIPQASGTFSFGVEYYDWDKTPQFQGSSTWVKDVTVGNWTQVSTTFEALPDIENYGIYCWLTGENCIAYIDDVSLRCVAEAKRASFTTDQVYYYTNEDVTTGTARITANSKIYTDFTSWTVDLIIKDGNNNIFERKNIPFSTEILDIDYPLSVLSDSTKEYTITATVNDSSGNVIFTEDKMICRKFARPSMMDKDGRFYVNGEEFVPIFGYHVYDQRDFYKQAKLLGINVIESEWGLMNEEPSVTIAKLDEIYKNGFMAIISLYYQETSGWADEYREGTKRLISAIKDHPAVFGYCMLDEPVAKNTDLSELGGAYEYIRSVDPVHPVYSCDQHPYYAEVLSQYNDIVAFDSYPYSTEAAVIEVSKTMESADFYIKNQKKPKMSIIQFFQHSQEAPWFPSPDEERNMIYQNWLAGSSGMGLYAIGYKTVTDYTTGTSIENFKTPTGDAIRAWYNNEKDIVTDHFVYGKGNVIEEVKDDSLWRKIWEVEPNEYYAVIMNRTTSAINNIEINNSIINNDTTIKIVGGGDVSNITSRSNGQLTLSLPASAAVLIHIDNQNGVIELDEGVGYSKKLYKENGEIYVELINKVSYTSQTFTINNSFINNNIFFEEISGNGNANITSLNDGEVKIKVKVNSSVTLKLVKADNTKPLLHSNHILVKSVTANQAVTCDGYADTQSIIALYDGKKLKSCVIGKVGEAVTMTVPDNVTDNCYFKVFRFTDELSPVTEETVI